MSESSRSHDAASDDLASIDAELNSIEADLESMDVGLEPGRKVTSHPQETPPPPPPLQLSGAPPERKPAAGPTQRQMLRIGLYILGACGFVALSSLVRPERSSASGERATPPSRLNVISGGETAATPAAPTAQIAPGRNAQGWLLLGVLEGATHDVWAYASPDGPRYTVVDAAGNIVLEDAPADDVYRAVPEVDLKNMRLEPGAEGGPLMMVDG